MQNVVLHPLTRIICVIFILWAGVFTRLNGQCNPPQLLPTTTCGAAPLVCLQDACYTTGNPTAGPHNGWCGMNTAIHNAQYFQFLATSTTVSIRIHVNTCNGAGCGLQSGIIDSCEWINANVVDCDPGTSAGGTMILFSNTMIIGDTYWLVIDGCGGQVCQYTIDYVDGVFTPGLIEELTDAFTSDPVVCQGQDIWTATAVNAISGAAGYLWTGFPWGNGTHTSTFNNMSGANDKVTIPDNAPPGDWEICVVAFTGCDTTDNEQCFTLTIEEIPDGVSAPVTLCPETLAFGVQWGSLNINAPGNYAQVFQTSEGCPYDSTKQYSVFPVPVPGVVDVIECALFYVYEGVTYTETDNYDLFYNNSSINGCDSTAVLNLDLIFLEVESIFLCEFTQLTLTAQVIQAIPSQIGIEYEWYKDGSLVSQEATFNTFDDGTYDLFVTYTIDGVACTFPATTNPLVIDLADLVPEAPVFDMISLNTCEYDSPVYSVEDEANIVEWVWTAPPGVEIIDNGSYEVGANWAGSTGGMICVHAVNHCGAGPDTCFNVVVIPSPIADFMMPSTTCVDSAVTIEFFGGVASDNATFLWNFGGGAQIISGGTGEGPHEVAWSSPGSKTVTLQVTEPGCDTSEIDYDIFVELLGQPVLSCISTVNSITFSWSPVTGAAGYQVNVLQGPLGVLAGTSYTVSGLLPGAMVEIEVVTMGTGACSETSASIECIAQSCPPKDLAIQLPSDSLCLGDVSGPISLAATVDGVVSTGTWSGPGVDPSGTFNPLDPAAGAGQHQIVFTYDDGNCIFNTQAIVYVFDTPTADFSIDLSICQDGDASVVYGGNASLGANFIWDFGPGASVVGGTGSGPYALHWNAPGMYAISLTVVENNCSSQIFTQNIEVQPILTAPVIQCFPTTSSVTFEWDSVPNATSYDVTQLFGTAGNVIGNQFVVTSLVPGDSVSIELTVSNSGLCPPVTLVVSCVAQNCPSPTLTITPVDDICLYPGTSTVDLEVTVTNGGGTGSWSGPAVIDATNGIFDPNLSGAGSHTLQYNYTDDGCSFVETVTVDVFEPPIADISNTALVLTCDNGNQLDLDGSTSIASGGIVYAWSTSDGVLLSAPDQAVVTAGAPGTYDLVVTDLTTGCEDGVSVTLTQDAGVPVADAGADGLLDCNINFLVLGGTSSVGPSIEYLWTTELGMITSDPTLPTITATAGGTYELLVTDVDNGCMSIDEAVVSVDTMHPSAILDVGAILDCDTETTTVTASITPVGNSFDYLWETADGMIQSGAGTSEIVASRPGIYTLYLTSQDNGCRDTVSIEVLGDDDVITGIEGSIDDPNCVGDVNGQIGVQMVMGGNAPFVYLWSNGATGDVVDNLGPGEYTVTITDANGCRLIETFNLPTPVALNPDIGPDLRYNINEIIFITLSVNNPATVADVIWEGVAPSCPGCMQIEFPADASGTVMVTVIDTNGCEATATLNLAVLRPRNVFVPSIFSPNGDSVNDVFTVGGNTITLVKSFRVFDRWGGLVYEELNVPANTTRGWDGTRNGKQLNPGVYVYMAELVHEDLLEEVIKGDVTLIR